MSAPESTRSQLLLLGELTLVTVTVAAVLGLGRVFVDGSFLPHVLVAAVAGHVVAAVCRRRRVPAPLTFVVSTVGLILLLSWFQLPETLRLGLPTLRTWHEAQRELRDAWHAFGQVVAPAPVLPGFILASSAGAWIIAFVSDTAAFRSRATVEALLPAGTLFLFGGALGVGGQRVGVAALFLAGVLGHWLARRALAQTSAPTWLGTEHGGTGSLLRVGGLLVLVGLAAAVVVGPFLPGADAKAVVPWRAADRKGPTSRVTISPLVDIRSRLVDQADVEVFRVKSDQRSYWRLTSLEKFDGRIWSSNRQYRPAHGTLGTDVTTHDATSRVAHSTFTISGLSSIWLPAAFRPTALSGTTARYDTDSNSLLTEADTPAGLKYSVTSVLPTLTPAELERVRPVAPASVAAEYTELPPGFSPAVQRLAGQVVLGATTQYDKAKKLQDFFRSGRFTYDLNVQPGHSGADLENFLFRLRRGYCEQFSGAYAAMARAVGLPSRVAVGFTPGDVDPATGQYVVKGFNGHAWPEVYLDGFGWVAFEPTPGRGMPGAQSYTGVPEAQAQAGNPSSATTVPVTTSTTAAPGSPATSAPPVQQARPATTSGHRSSPWPRRLVLTAVVLVVAPVLWAALLALARAARRRRRRRSATTPDERVLVAWDEVTEALGRAGTPAEVWETPDEFAARAGAADGIDAALLAGLAGLTTAATFGPDGVPDSAALEAAQAADALEDAAAHLLDPRQRVRLALDPRPLLPDRASRVDVRQTV